ncbi:hypothetical protein FZ983_11310 [Azospirillum sp. B21]|uniref:hypothetical protein n=1 Tax=Azospirillum sp. B21 TaxID=2607496 RepID=UPI0011F01E37|nr:hypothetical protein [Azospirillum sp. B21]KAA0580181.1 hypothetical protein FZ983_11310 [Azospirillum sp. B21]
MNDSPDEDIDGFIDELRQWALSTQRFARKVHALSYIQQSLAAELRVESEEILHQVQSRRRSETEVRKLFIGLHEQ